MNEVLEKLITPAVGVVGFFLAKHFGKVDKTSSETGALRERIGQLEMRLDAAFRLIDDQKERLKELREDLRDAA